VSLIYEPAGRAREYAPLALNPYNGCTHGCSYCFAPAVLHKPRAVFHADPAPRADVIAKLERELDREPAGKPRPPVLLCFTTDLYQPRAAETGISRRAIELLHEYGYPVQVLTKGGMRSAVDFDLLGAVAGDAYAATLTFIEPAASAEWEPGAALPAERLAALALAHAEGITTWASLEPVVDPEQTLALIREAHGYVDLFKVGKLNYDPLAKTIDWPAFAARAVALLEELGARYYVKNDLRRYLGGGDATTD